MRDLRFGQRLVGAVQILAGIRSLRNKQRTVHGATSNGTSNGSYTSFLPNEKIVKNPVPVKARAQSPQLPGHYMQPMTQRADSSQVKMYVHSELRTSGSDFEEQT